MLTARVRVNVARKRGAEARAFDVERSALRAKLEQAENEAPPRTSRRKSRRQSRRVSNVELDELVDGEE